MPRAVSAERVAGYLTSIARILWVLVLGIRLACWLTSSIAIQFTPIDAYHLESKMVWLSREVRDGRSLYPDWRTFPYESNFFGPIYFAAVGLTGRILKLDDESLRTCARVVTWSSVVVLALVSRSLVFRETADWRAGWVAAAGFVVSGPTLGFGQMARPDVLALAFGMVGYWVYMNHASSHARLLAPVLLAAAVLTKQTAVVPAVALVAWLFFSRRWLESVLVAVSFAGSAGLFIGVYSWAVEPRMVLDLFGATVNEPSLGAASLVWSNVWRSMPDLGLALMVVLGLSAFRRASSRFCLFAVVAIGWDALTCFKIGSDRNYFLDTAMAGSMAVGLLWSRIKPELRPASARSVFAPLVWFAVLALATWGSFRCSLTDAVLRSSAYRAYHSTHPVAREWRALLRLVQSPDVRVLSDSCYLAYQNREPPPFVDPWLFRCLVEADWVRPTELLRRITDREYDFVVTTSPIESPEYDRYEFGFPPIVANKLREHYVPYYVPPRPLAGLFLYYPRPTPP